MSSPILDIIHGLVNRLNVELEREIPANPGPNATPNTIQRHLYRAKNAAEELGSILEEIQNKRAEMAECLQKIAAAMRENKERVYLEFCQRLDIETKINQAEIKKNEWRVKKEHMEDLSELLPESSVGSGVHTPRNQIERIKRVKIPPIRLKKFDGSVESWIPFWETFRVHVHEDNSVTKIEKHNLLESNLEGEAKDLIEGIPISEDGYQIAIDLLLEKFGKNSKLIRALNQEIILIPQSDTVEEDEKLYIKFEKICRQLSSLNQNMDLSPHYLSLEGKLSPLVLDKYFVIKDAEDNQNWDTTKFRNALSRAIEQIKNRQEVRQKCGKERDLNYNRNDSEVTMNFAVKFREEWEKVLNEQKHKKFGKNQRDNRRSFSSSEGSEKQYKNPKFERFSRNQKRGERGRKNGSPYPSKFRSNSNSSNYSNNSFYSSKSPPKYPCHFCENLHSPIICKTYPTAEKRKDRAVKRQLCLRCLKKGHFAKNCNSQKKNCVFCKSANHHSALCRWSKLTDTNQKRENFVNAGTKEEGEEVLPSTSNESIIAASCLITQSTKISVLKCKYVTIYNPENRKLYKRVLAFLDDGSQKTYIEEELARSLKLTILSRQKLELSGLGGVNLGKFESPVVEFGLKAKNFDMLMTGRAIKKVLKEVPILDYEEIKREELEKNKISVPYLLEEPKITIGSDYYNYLDVSPTKHLNSGFWICKSKIGKILSGDGKINWTNINGEILNRKDEYNVSSIVSSIVQKEGEITDQIELDQDRELISLVRQHDSLNSVGLGDLTEKEENMREKMIKNISFNGKRYQSKLLWIEEEAEKLPTNFAMAYSQLKANLNRLRSNPDLLELYHKTILDQVNDQGSVEKTDPLVDPNQKGQKIHYLPHHAVVKETSEHTKLRIVYNASAKSGNNPALNECIEKGVNEYNDLTGIQLRTRLKNILIGSDIAKAFHQIELAPEDRNCVRFLWVENPFNPYSPLVHYRFKRVTFGVICSPAQLALTIKIHLEKYDHPLIKQLIQNIYVDNLIVGINDKKEFKIVYKMIKQIFSEAGMDVREFVSNELNEIQKLPKEDRIEKETVKLLGIWWNVREDEFIIKMPKFETSNKVTRRKVLSQIAKTFDPCGITAPIILAAKLFRQEIENGKNLKWDTKLSEKEEQKWRDLMLTWENKEIKYPRKIFKKNLNEKSKFQLHAFTDACSKAFGAAIYLRIENNGQIDNNLIFAKSLVVPANMPLGKRTIPNLELHGTMLCGKYLNFVKNELEKETKIQKCTIWTDSTDVLDFVRSERKFDKFIKNRVQNIKKWHLKHVDGKNNPADLASRGSSVEELQNSELWWKGPEFLSKMETDWPKTIREYDPMNPPEAKEKQNIIYEINSAIEQEIFFNSEKFFQRFSKWNRLRNTVAYVIRAWEKQERKASLEKNKKDQKFKKNNSEGKPIKELVSLIRPLEINEIAKAEILILKLVQENHPPTKSLIKSLDLFKDDNQLWRTRGRILQSGLNYDTINPIFIPNNSYIVTLLIRDIHLKTMHGGRELVNSQLRQKYWIPKSRRKIYELLKKNNKEKCGICAKFANNKYNYPKNPPLPIFRVKGKSAFENVGIDYFGPLTVKGMEGNKKCWGAIFTCLVVRAIHLELVSDNSTEKFLLAFRRFIKRRRVPKIIISDNGSTFVLANKALKQITLEENKQNKIWSEIFRDEKIQNFSKNLEIDWKFNSPYASWRGGAFERMIGLVKTHLIKSLGKKLLGYEELLTYLIEVERIVNERPLCYLTQDEVIESLRPIDILNPTDGEPYELKLDPTFEREDLDEYFERKNNKEELFEIYKKAIFKSEIFWREWSEKYLLSLREKHLNKNKEGDKYPKIGQVVVVRDQNNYPRSMWKLGRIQEILSDRTVKLKIGNRTSERPINLLYPLEIENEN